MSPTPEIPGPTHEANPRRGRGAGAAAACVALLLAAGTAVWMSSRASREDGRRERKPEAAMPLTVGAERIARAILQIPKAAMEDGEQTAAQKEQSLAIYRRMTKLTEALAQLPDAEMSARQLGEFITSAAARERVLAALEKHSESRQGRSRRIRRGSHSRIPVGRTPPSCSAARRALSRFEEAEKLFAESVRARFKDGECVARGCGEAARRAGRSSRPRAPRRLRSRSTGGRGSTSSPLPRSQAVKAVRRNGRVCSTSSRSSSRSWALHPTQRAFSRQSWK